MYNIFSSWDKRYVMFYINFSFAFMKHKINQSIKPIEIIPLTRSISDTDHEKSECI